MKASIKIPKGYYRAMSGAKVLSTDLYLAKAAMEWRSVKNVFPPTARIKTGEIIIRKLK